MRMVDGLVFGRILDVTAATGGQRKNRKRDSSTTRADAFAQREREEKGLGSLRSE